MKTSIRRIQQYLGVTQDGLMGPETIGAICKALQLPEIPVWPAQSAVRASRSLFGAPGQEDNLVSIIPPYQLYYEGKAVKHIRVHKCIARHVREALAEVLEHYGIDEIRRLGLDQFGGCYNCRPTATGKSLSLHAWGVALDFAPGSNAYGMKAPRASLSHRDCETWWQIWERHGAVSLGRERNYDWMHLQFARLE